MPLDLTTEAGPISLKDAKLQDVLADLQGNILNGHGRDQALHLFLQFSPARLAEVKRKIASLANGYITTAKKQLANSEHFKKTKEDGGVFTHFALSGAGYRALQISDAQIPRGAKLRNRPAELDVPGPGGATVKVPFYSDQVFADGMKARQLVLQDPAPLTWEPGYQAEIHALLILADDNNLELIEAERQFRVFMEADAANPIMKVMAVDRGFGLRRKFYEEGPEFGENVEHFGYVDGRSQPVLLDTQLKEEQERDGTNVWNPVAPPRLVLLQDPGGSKGVSFGSFLVFRKLEQNVKGFRRAEADLAEELGLPRKLVGAMAVGRFEDGTPVVLQPGEDADPAVPNDFDYQSDAAGLKCPFHAHIRKTNPRKESFMQGGAFAQSEEEELGHRIARRGIPYGGALSDFSDLDSLPTQGLGLLFMCYQSDIWEQFEFIQRFWANNRTFLQPGLLGTAAGAPDYVSGTGLDAIIGQQVARNIDPLLGDATAPRNWPSEWGKAAEFTNQSIAQFVTLKGGEYFFSPSLTFLKSLVPADQEASLEVITPPNLYRRNGRPYSKRIVGKYDC